METISLPGFDLVMSPGAAASQYDQKVVKSSVFKPPQLQHKISKSIFILFSILLAQNDRTGELNKWNFWFDHHAITGNQLPTLNSRSMFEILKVRPGL